MTWLVLLAVLAVGMALVARRARRRSLEPRPDYRRIAELERELGLDATTTPADLGPQTCKADHSWVDNHEPSTGHHWSSCRRCGLQTERRTAR